MGSQTSLPIDPLNGPRGVCCISLNSYDRIRLTYGSQEEINAISTVIANCWRPGTPCKKYGGSIEWVLGGSPFGQGGFRSYQSPTLMRRVLLEILQTMDRLGWELEVASDLSRKATSLSSMFFSKKRAPKPEGCEMLCLFLAGVDKIRIVPDKGQQYTLNGQSGFYIANPNLVRLTNALVNVCRPFLARQRVVDNVYELKLHGLFWHANGTETVKMRRTMCSILEVLRHEGFVLNCAIDQTTTTDVSSLYFKKVEYENMNRSRVVCLSLNMSDRLRYIDNLKDEATTRALDVAIQNTWGRATRGTYGDEVEFKLSGTPWSASADAAIRSRVLMARIFEAMASNGWTLEATLNLTRKSTDKSTFFFQRTLGSGSVYPVACISLNRSDTIRIIDAPVDLRDAVNNAIVRGWPLGVSKQLTIPIHDCVETRLRGDPFYAHGTDTVHVRSMFCFILAAVQAQGWRVVSSADVSQKTTGGDNPTSIDVHSWYLSSTVPIASSDSAATMMEQSYYSSNKSDLQFAHPVPEPSAPPPDDTLKNNNDFKFHS